jgi:hypothetical protein
MEKYIWSLDISTTNIGSALWSENGELIELKHLKLKTDKNIPVQDRDIYKADVFREYVLDYKDRVSEEYNGVITHTIVEEPLGGSNNAKTVALLHGFNGMCRYILYNVFNVKPQKISVHDSRKIYCPELVTTKIEKGKIKETLSFPNEYKKDKKRYIWEKVSKQHPEIEWIYKRCGGVSEESFDMSDSYCVGYSGLVNLGIIKK